MKSKSDRDLKVALDVPIWSQITTMANITNRHVKYSVEATPGHPRHMIQIWGVPPHHGHNAPDEYYWDPFALQKYPQINHTPLRALCGSPQSVISKSDCNLKVTLDVPIWSQITTSANITNRHVKYSVEVTSGPGTRDTLSTCARFGVFHNTTDQILQMGNIGTH